MWCDVVMFGLLCELLLWCLVCAWCVVRVLSCYVVLCCCLYLELFCWYCQWFDGDKTPRTVQYRRVVRRPTHRIDCRITTTITQPTTQPARSPDTTYMYIGYIYIYTSTSHVHTAMQSIHHQTHDNNENQHTTHHSTKQSTNWRWAKNTFVDETTWLSSPLVGFVAVLLLLLFCRGYVASLLRKFPDLDHCLTIPSSPAVASAVPSKFHATAVTAPVCAFGTNFSKRPVPDTIRNEPSQHDIQNTSADNTPPRTLQYQRKSTTDI